MSVPYVAVRHSRTLSVVYRFYDAFFFPIADGTPPVSSPLEVSIPEMRWRALKDENDFTYRFSAQTLTMPAPSGVNLAVEVSAIDGDYVSFEPIQVSLPLAVPAPPKRSDFLIGAPLWPTPALRPPAGETAVRGRVWSPTAQPIEDLKVEMWPGSTSTPPPGTPYTRTNANGDFLFRFPLMKGAAGASVSFRARLNDGLVAVSPLSVPLILGRTGIVELQRT